jgi:hypothetical protein
MKVWCIMFMLFGSLIMIWGDIETKWTGLSVLLFNGLVFLDIKNY